MTQVHVHASAIDFTIVAAYVVIFAFLWRFVAAKLAANGSPLGDAMLALI